METVCGVLCVCVCVLRSVYLLPDKGLIRLCVPVEGEREGVVLLAPNCEVTKKSNKFIIKT